MLDLIHIIILNNKTYLNIEEKCIEKQLQHLKNRIIIRSNKTTYLGNHRLLLETIKTNEQSITLIKSSYTIAQGWIFFNIRTSRWDISLWLLGNVISGDRAVFLRRRESALESVRRRRVIENQKRECEMPREKEIERERKRGETAKKGGKRV